MSKIKSVLKTAFTCYLPENDPGFMIIGAQKCGTSSLHYQLNKHPQLKGSHPKEVHYFDRDIYFGKGIRDYRKHFRGKRDLVYFESSPSYIYSPGTAKKIQEIFPQIKLIITLRDPIKRAYSAWNHYRQLFESGRYRSSIESQNRRAGNYLFEKLFQDRAAFPSFYECIQIEQHLIKKGDGFEPALLRRGLYLEQLKSYWQYFDRDQIKVIGFKQLVTDTANTLDSITDFIGVNRHAWPQSELISRNVREYQEPISEECKLFLDEYYAVPNEKLFARVGELNW